MRIRNEDEAALNETERRIVRSVWYSEYGIHTTQRKEDDKMKTNKSNNTYRFPASWKEERIRARWVRGKDFRKRIRMTS